ncbi:MAG: hypothetical protein U0791_21165 [Gemmataceae bacterium]
MTLLNVLRNHPVALAGVLFAAFAAWVASDFAGRAVPPAPPADALQVVEIQAPPSDDLQLPAQRPGVVTADLLTRLQPGMARAAVEQLIGLPPAGLVHPVAVVDGRFVYRASYLANLESGFGRNASPAARSLIAIEFDAGSPGHPLLKVHVPDPMS